jgi:hypothetical protein
MQVSQSDECLKFQTQMQNLCEGLSRDLSTRATLHSFCK